jgi:hypothetical protein
MIPDLCWDGLFEVIELTLNPTRKRTPAPPSKHVTKSKPKSKKAKAKLRSRRKTKQKTAAEAKKPRAKAAKFVAKTHRPGRTVRRR